MRKVASKNKVAVKKFQACEKLLFYHLSKTSSIACSFLQQTEGIVVFQQQSCAKHSVGTLKNYSQDMMHLCERKEYDMKKLQKQMKILQKAFADVEKQIADLILIFRCA